MACGEDGIPALDLASAAALTAACTHCGLCLESCPTYLLSGDETESPRGRIILVEDAIEQGGFVSAVMAEHVDSCLGCLGCVTACPEGVRYDQILLRARDSLPRSRRRLLSDVVEDPRRLRSLPRVISRVGKLSRLRLPLYTPSVGTTRGRVALLTGCGEGAAASALHRAAVGVLSAEGYDVVVPPSPDCCGAIEAQAGELDAAVRRARAAVTGFDAVGRVDHVLSTSAGCGLQLKRFGELLGDERATAFAASVRDICELLGEQTPRAPRAPLSLRVAYHDPCQLAHGQGVRAQPRALIASIPQLELVEVIHEPEICCGAPGVRALTHPETADALGQRKVQNMIATKVQLIAAPSPGCAAHLTEQLRRLGSDIPVEHPVQLLWRSINAARGSHS